MGGKIFLFHITDLGWGSLTFYALEISLLSMKYILTLKVIEIFIIKEPLKDFYGRIFPAHFLLTDFLNFFARLNSLNSPRKNLFHKQKIITLFSDLITVKSTL